MPLHWKPQDEEYMIPSAEALLASTMALMTGHVQSCCAEHREAMATKIVSNLSRLSSDPLLSPGFQALLWSLRQRWLAQGQAATAVRPVHVESGLWHPTPEAVQ
ncbi:hypothetical protein [Rhodoferax sp.]|uniref:hypothetical protein n=1 Tax=Rhodoferax sp. TaxID=50421 RepID=UPI002ACD9CC4|nr:hypothetical protein [Rhodoferax sp.]MDZ7892558.1 hypothetical protein [Rhodoferax sp.]MDZ7918594.1 hypothetical protein [Rhodoferax sp.]